MVMINTSASEGMSCSILESFAEGVPVIARRNDGNCELVKDGVNGYIYETGAEFIHKFEALLANEKEVRERLCGEAYKMVSIDFSYEKEASEYEKVIRKYYTPLLYNLNLKTLFEQTQNLKEIKGAVDKAVLLSIREVHPISSVNLEIFSKFF
jgi:spore maturation protein CgeB